MRVHKLLVTFFWAVSSSLLTLAQNSPPTPCPDVFYYTNENAQTIGVVIANNPPPYGSVMLIKIKLSVAARLPAQHPARIEPFYDNNVVLQNIQQGSPIYYKIYFPLSYPIPNVVSIEFDNNIICSGPPAVGNFITTLTLSHTFRSGGAFTGGNNAIQPPRRPIRPRPETTTLLYRPIEEYVPVQPYNPPSEEEEYIPPRRPTMRKTTPAPVDEGFFSYVSCGVPENKKTIGLISGGEIPSREEWPWLVALFKRTGDSGNIRKEFKCGASLVSEKLVLTAAHCVTNGAGKSIKIQQVLLKIGAYDIDDETDEFALFRTPSRIMIADKYDPNTFANDLSVLVLTTVVTFNKYVKPVCLWDSSDRQDLIYNKNATVVGWGRDESGASVTSEPRAVRVPIVPSLTCKTSNSILYNLVSNTTLCAGNRDNTGPCNGDSGGGLFLKQGNKWFLRGIVSNSLSKEQERICDLAEYVIYTDVAKYASWLNSIY